MSMVASRKYEMPNGNAGTSAEQVKKTLEVTIVHRSPYKNDTVIRDVVTVDLYQGWLMINTEWGRYALPQAEVMELTELYKLSH